MLDNGWLENKFPFGSLPISRGEMAVSVREGSGFELFQVISTYEPRFKTNLKGLAWTFPLGTCTVRLGFI